MATANCRYKTASDGTCVPRPVLSILFAIFCLSLIGCGVKHPATVPVRGAVTYGGGPWPTGGRLLFTIAEDAGAELPRRPGIAEFDAQGNFTVRTWKDADGLRPGRYRVGVECWKIPPVMGGPPPVSYVPAAYQNPMTSGIELVITSGDSARTLQFDIPPNDAKKQ